MEMEWGKKKNRNSTETGRISGTKHLHFSA